MSKPSNGNGKPTGGKTLEDWRLEINALDSEMVRLLNQRARIACAIGSIKVASGLPAYDGRRERQVLDRVCAENSGPLSNDSIAQIFRGIIRETRRIGTKSMEEQREQIDSGINKLTTRK